MRTSKFELLLDVLMFFALALALFVGISACQGAQLAIAWTDNADNEDGFYLERRTNDGDWAQVATVPALPGKGAVFYADKDLLPDTVYVYRVRAYNTTGKSAYSNSKSARTKLDMPLQLPPIPPTLDSVKPPLVEL